MLKHKYGLLWGIKKLNCLVTKWYSMRCIMHRSLNWDMAPSFIQQRFDSNFFSQRANSFKEGSKLISESKVTIMNVKRGQKPNVSAQKIYFPTSAARTEMILSGWQYSVQSFQRYEVIYSLMNWWQDLFCVGVFLVILRETANFHVF